MISSTLSTNQPLFLSPQVSVNGVEVRAVKPGVYRHTITGRTVSQSGEIRVICNVTSTLNTDPILAEYL